jgi:hypothetical protein
LAALGSTPSSPQHLDARLLRVRGHRVADALAVDLLVVEHVQLGDPVVLMYVTCAAAWMLSAGTTRP